MKKIALWSMLFCLCATSGYAQRADVAKNTKEQKQEAKAVQGDILFKTAVEAIKAEISCGSSIIPGAPTSRKCATIS